MSRRDFISIVISVGLLLLISATPTCASGITSENYATSDSDVLMKFWDTHHKTPQEYILQKFRNKKWIFIGEYHRIKHDVDFIASLIPLLHEKTDVRRLAFEFLGVDETQRANKLITAERYDRRQMIDFFRKQFVSWPYNEYLNIFKSAWDSNRKFAAKHGPFEFVGLHPGINYELINYGTDMEAVKNEKDKLSQYDKIMAEALEQNILKRDHKALVYTGIAHSTAKFTEYIVGTKDPLPRMGNMVYREPYSKDMFFICLHSPFYDSGQRKDIYPFDGVLDKLMSEFKKDIGFDIVSTPFAGLIHTTQSPYSITSYTFAGLYDGYIMFKTSIKEYVGVTCIKDWITNEEQFRHFWRNLANREASEAFSKISFEEFMKDFCAPRPDHGGQFKRRFRNLPDIE